MIIFKKSLIKNFIKYNKILLNLKTEAKVGNFIE